MATSTEWGAFEWGAGEWGSSATDSGGFSRDETIPVESGKLLIRTEILPVENSGAKTVTLDVDIPIDSIAGGTRVNRDEAIPVESDGVDPNKLLLIWSVRVKLDVPFQLMWNVVAAGLAQSLVLQWNVRQTMPPLTLRWNVIPDLLNPLINNDVQMPVGIITKTP